MSDEEKQYSKPISPDDLARLQERAEEIAKGAKPTIKFGTPVPVGPTPEQLLAQILEEVRGIRTALTPGSSSAPGGWTEIEKRAFAKVSTGRPESLTDEERVAIEKRMGKSATG